MKAATKKIFANIYTELSKLDVQSHVDDVTDIAGDLQAEFDDKSERWQEGGAGQAAEATLDKVVAVQTALETLQEALDDAISALTDMGEQ